MNFTKEDGRKVMTLLALNWAGAMLLSGVLVVVSHRVFTSTFTMSLSVFCGMVILAFLGKRDVLSALLMLGGGLILFAITVIVHSAFFPPDVFPT